MLKRVVKWVMNNNQTVFVVPISLGYDRIVESDSHLEVLSGGGAGWKEGGWVYGGEKEGGDGDDAKKFATGMTSMGKTASLIMNVTCFGRVDLCIATPIDLGAFLQECMGSLYGSGGAVEKGGKFEGMTKKGMIKYLAMSVGYQALYLCNKVNFFLTSLSFSFSFSRKKKILCFLFSDCSCNNSRFLLPNQPPSLPLSSSLKQSEVLTEMNSNLMSCG